LWIASLLKIIDLTEQHICFVKAMGHPGLEKYSSECKLSIESNCLLFIQNLFYSNLWIASLLKIIDLTEQHICFVKAMGHPVAGRELLKK
jgi:hypothetical protein